MVNQHCQCDISVLFNCCYSSSWTQVEPEKPNGARLGPGCVNELGNRLVGWAYADRVVVPIGLGPNGNHETLIRAHLDFRYRCTER